MAADRHPERAASAANAEQFREWGRAAMATARRCSLAEDKYGAALATARSHVYVEAAALIDQHGDNDAAVVMLDRVAQLRITTPPLLGFDAAGLDYIRARAWQYCAHYLNPDAPTVQPAWPTD